MNLPHTVGAPGAPPPSRAPAVKEKFFLIHYYHYKHSIILQMSYCRTAQKSQKCIFGCIPLWLAWVNRLSATITFTFGRLAARHSVGPTAYRPH